MKMISHAKERKKLKQYLKKLEDKPPKRLTSEYVSESYSHGSTILGLAVMKLLEEISKDKREEVKEDIEMGIGEQRFQCELCNGEGYTHQWDEKGKVPKLIIKDCTQCKGEGLHTIIVEDKRKVSKGRKLEYRDTY